MEWCSYSDVQRSTESTLGFSPCLECVCNEVIEAAKQIDVRIPGLFK